MPVYNNGILKFIEDDLRIFSSEKWDKHEDLRIYMIEDLETNYILNGRTEEFVINLLGEPSDAYGKAPGYIEYYISSGLFDPVRFYIVFEDGVVLETGKHYS